jgi:hypothetical protein
MCGTGRKRSKQKLSGAAEYMGFENKKYEHTKVSLHAFRAK